MITKRGNATRQLCEPIRQVKTESRAISSPFIEEPTLPKAYFTVTHEI